MELNFLPRVQAALARVRARFSAVLADRDTDALKAAIAARDNLLERVTGAVEAFADETDALTEPAAETVPATEITPAERTDTPAEGGDDNGDDTSGSEDTPEG